MNGVRSRGSRRKFLASVALGMVGLPAYARWIEPRWLGLRHRHNPDGKEQLQSHPWKLMLCGHTHGGQLALPLIGTPFAPVKGQQFVEGLHRWDNRWIHVTGGVGNVYGFRFNCRPEISLLSLV